MYKPRSVMYTYNLKLLELALNAARLAYPMFIANNWKYGDNPTPPTEVELYRTCRDLLRRASEGPTTIATGRFIVHSYRESPNDLPTLEIALDLGYVSGIC